MNDYKYVGSSPPRPDARSKVTGRAFYIEDMQQRGMLYGKVLRSKYAHARIISIDTSGAERLPGVYGVVTGAELPFIHGEALKDDRFLARDKVRYRGEGVAAVAAVDEETAERAIELIEVQYEELPAVFDPEEAAKPGAPLIHEELDTYKCAPGINPIPGTNICNHFQLRKGDVEEGFSESDFIVEDSFTTGMQQHASIETHGAVCLVDDESRITLWANNDSPYRTRKEIADALKIPQMNVRVICAATIGGNFGGKGGVKAEACALALAWKIRNKPIRVIFSREEEFSSAIVRHPTVIYLKSGVKNDGTILARQVKLYFATGAYAEKGPTVTRFGSVSAAGPYSIPHVSIDGYCVYTNRQMSGAMRGYGGPQASWAYESHMDNIARSLSLDPLELRLKHVYRDGDHHLSGQEIFSEGLAECLEKVAERMNWGKPLGRNQGRGIACMERAVKTPFGSAAFVKINEDGTADVLSSTTEVGQGSETIICQIVAEELGVPVEWVRKAAPDTAFTPYDTSTTSSRSTFHMGNAVRTAAADAKAQILNLAAPLLDAKPEDLEIREGNVLVKGRNENALSLARVMSKHYGHSGTVLGRGFYFPKLDHPEEYFSTHMIFWLLGAHGVEVEVNRETGEVKILKVYAAHDTGKAIHPSNCVGQIEGGVSMGLGYAMYEEFMFRGAELLNPSFLNYKIPTALDMPEIESILVECTHREGPFGAKGMGETTNVPLPAAIANAIYDAVGVRIRELPITPDKILAALRKHDRERGHRAANPTDGFSEGVL
jgi:CO/xanthine dehydrogenase Mo-binding subunit